MPFLNYLRIFFVAMFVVVWGNGFFLLGQDDDSPSADQIAPSEDAQKEDDQKDKRLPVPSQADVKEATKLVADIYKSELKKANTPALKQAFAKKLLADGIDTKDDPTGRFVLFQMARNQAANYGDVETAFEAIDQMAKSFKIDTLEEQAKVVIKVAGKTTLPAKQRMAVVKLGMELIDRAVAQDQYKLANRVAVAILSAVRKLKDYKLLKLFVVRKKELGELSDKYAIVKKALVALERNPTHPAANQAVGEYRCYVKGDWVKGLSMLALGTDPALKKLAIVDLKGASSAIGQVKLGDAWWSLAEKSEGLLLNPSG